MRLTLLFLSFIWINVSLFAQKVDLDGEAYSVNYIRLPQKPFPAEFQTYSTGLSADPGDLKAIGLQEPFFLNYLKVQGFERIAKGGNFYVEANLGNFKQVRSETQTRKESVKDKAGKITDTYYYTHVGIYEHSLSLKIVDQNGKVIEERSFVSGERTFKSKEFGSLPELNKYLEVGNFGRDLAYHDQKTIGEGMQAMSRYINAQYGYSPFVENGKLQILDSEKHPDYVGFQSAYQTARKAFAAIKAESPLDSAKNLMAPAIEYFSKQKDKYNTEEKNERKLKYACLYNLALIHFWLEDLDKSAEYALAVVANDHDPKDGKRLLEDIEALRASLGKTNKTTRHFKIKQEVSAEVKEQAVSVQYNSDSEDRKKAFKDETLGLTANTVKYDGKIYASNGKETDVIFLVENPRMISLSFGSGGNVRYAIDQGEKYKVFKLDKGNTAGFYFDGRTFKMLPFKSANSVNVGGGKAILEVIYESPAIMAYLAYTDTNDAIANPPEYVIYDVKAEDYISLNSLKFALNLNKGVKKAFSDCPAVMEAAEKDGFKKNTPDIIKLAKLLETCKK